MATRENKHTHTHAAMKKTESPSNVLRDLQASQHRRCEAHRLWSEAFDAVLTGTITVSSFCAAVGTLTTAMQTVSNTFRAVRDGETYSCALFSDVRMWAADLQSQEKELYDCTVALQRCALSHATSASLAVPPPRVAEDHLTTSTTSQNSTTTTTTADNGATEQPVVHPSNPVVHCSDCAIVLFISNAQGRGGGQRRDTTATAAEKDVVAVPHVVRAWSIDDSRNTLDEEESDGDQQVDADQRVTANRHGGANQMRAAKNTAQNRCRAVSHEWAVLTQRAALVRQRLADLMDACTEMIVDVSS
jgi:hypothetical protein